jgi:type II secretory pathway pseudopilin PulG
MLMVIMRARLAPDDQGFTVVELVITIAICGIIIPVLAAGLTTLTLINNRSRDLALANMMAQNKAELLRSSGFNSINVGTTDFSGDLPSTLSNPKSASYTVSLPEAGIKEVAITISYKDINTTRTVNYLTKISELGINQ